MCENLKNRAVIISKGDYKSLEFMLWLYDIRIIDVALFGSCPGTEIVLFRCSDEKYQTLYEKMDSLGIWKGELVNPKIENGRVTADDVNVVDEYAKYRWLIIGV